MYQTLQILSILLASVVMGLALAHALERPGKLRLDHPSYLKVQSIYYPGFTIGGLAEVLVIIAVLALAALTPASSALFWPTIVALLAFLMVQVVFWLVVQPPNKFWMKDQELNGAGRAFFSAGPAPEIDGEWTKMRDRWDAGHITRAIFGAIGLVALVSGAVTT